MKNPIFKYLTATGIMLILITGCEPEPRINLVQNDALREDVFMQIIQNEELFNEFIEETRQDEQAMNWMVSQGPVMPDAWGQDRMRSMIQENPEFVDSLMLNMTRVMESDTSLLQNRPQIHRRMMNHLLSVVEQDTALWNEMQRRMEERGLE